MKYLLIHIVIWSCWMIFTQHYSGLNWVTGFIIGYAVVAAYCIISKKSIYHIRLIRAARLLLFFHYELITSSIRVLWDIITPTEKSNPGFLAMPLDAKTDVEIFFTANLISLTPGTLSMDISEDRSTLYIHAMFIDATTIASLKYFESKVLGVFR